MPPLSNARHERFAQELAKGKSADEAYVAAGYSPARQNAHRLMTNDDVRARVAEILQRGAERAEITVENVLRELAKIGFSNMLDYMRPGPDGDPYLDFSALTRDQAAALQEVATDAETITGTDTIRAVTPANVAAKTIRDFLSVLIEAPANQDYVIARNLPYGLVVTSITTKSASGTCTLTGKINTTALGGTANSVSSTETTQAHSSANAAAVGDDLVLTVSSNATCLRMEVTVAFTRALGT